MLRIIKPIVVIVIILFAGPSIYMTYKKVKAADAIEEANLALQLLNDELKFNNTEFKNEIARLKRENGEIEKRAYKKFKRTEPTYKKQSTRNKEIIKQESKKDNFYKSYNNVTPKKKETVKKSPIRYPQYSSLIRMESDSKISKNREGKLVSNARIYGHLKTLPLFRYNCKGQYDKVRGMDRECFLVTSQEDKLYFPKKRFEEFKKFNSKRHIIKCKYSRKWGLLYDCDVEDDGYQRR